MTSSRNTRQPAVDPALTNKLVTKFGKRLLKEGFTGVPVLVQKYYRQVPGNPRYDRENNLICEVSYMTPTEFAIMTDVWSHWWSGDSLPWPSVPDIAEHLGKCVRQVRRYLKRMQESGWVLTIAQSNHDGRQLSNRYDFTPFLRKLIAYLESIGVLEKPIQEGGEGDIFARERVTLLPGRRVTFSPPESDSEITDSPKEDESMIRGGANRAELEKGSVLPTLTPAYSHITQGAIGNETDTNGTTTNNTEENEHSNNENSEENSRPARVKDVEANKNGKKESKLEKMAAAMGVSWEAVEQMEAWLKACPRPETAPTLQAGPDLVPLGGLMTGWSRQLGDSAHSKSNVTQVTKICLFATEHGLIDEEFVSCLSRTYDVTQKRYKKGELNAPLAFFFRTLKLDILATLAVCGERDVPSPAPVVEADVFEESEQQELVAAGEEESASAETAAPGAQVAAEAEQLVEVLVTNDPAIGFSSQDITEWWADRLLNGLDPEHQSYRYTVYPTDKGKWGFVLFSKEHEEDTWTFTSHHQVNECLHPVPEGVQN